MLNLKKCTVILMVLLSFTVFPTNVFAESALLPVPQLYSGAAVLMDADTGQVLYGKNMTTKMYPASITKMMTLLLAMERGNPADEVTMTDEGVFTVPRGTTHIALTPGETLTLEQLEYAMMVESANDAANGIAIHLSGTIEQFAHEMTKRAAELGAENTNFTNANGLPDDRHYTCAYDMGLITREAMTRPEFSQLAGTRYYEIPPTNKQSETRRMNNRQYMFCLNDTYPGAYAGKTGWTEDAGHTLITVAERGGVKLICVVLKAVGAVDAEFKDSTALLDYGFDNFKRINVPGSIVQEQEISLTDAQGEQISMLLRMDEDMPVLVPKDMETDALEIRVNVPEQPDATSIQQASVEIAVPESAGMMFPVAGTFKMTAEQPVIPVTSDDSGEDAGVWKEILFTVLKWAGIVIAAGLFGLLILRRIMLARYRARKRARARTVRARQAAQNASSRRTIDVTVDKARKNKIKVLRDDIQ